MIWEELDERTSESVELSGGLPALHGARGDLAAIGIFLDSPILVVGAMVVGPEFGPVAGLCVALVQKRGAARAAVGDRARRRLPARDRRDRRRDAAVRRRRPRPRHVRHRQPRAREVDPSPDAFAFIVALCAGTAGMLSLSTAKSGALIGVLISVTTIPAAANIGIAAAYGDWDTFGGSAGQLARQPGRDPARRHAHALHPAPALPPAQAATASRRGVRTTRRAWSRTACRRGSARARRPGGPRRPRSRRSR